MTPEELYELIELSFKITPTAEEVEKLKEYRANNTDEQIISDLSKLSLKYKWNKDSEERLCYICPFCKFTVSLKGRSWIESCSEICRDCLCPKEICSRSSRNGYISDLERKYDGEFSVSNLQDSDLNHMISLFQEHIIN
jgi:hypothetical protein